MRRIAETFKELKRTGRLALIPFFTAGYPSEKVFVELVKEAALRGADIVEIGVPFSDPVADGPSIQFSYARALENGISLSRTLELIPMIRNVAPELPLVIMSYYNPILQFGVERFCRKASAAGVDGILVPDLPPDEGALLERCAKGSGMCLTYFLAPNSRPNRIRLVAGRSSGFIYMVSVTGVTGARKSLPATLVKSIEGIRRHTGKPLCVGFGISSMRQIKPIEKMISGVIVGSAIVDLIRNSRGRSGAVVSVGDFIGRFRRPSCNKSIRGKV